MYCSSIHIGVAIGCGRGKALVLVNLQPGYAGSTLKVVGVLLGALRLVNDCYSTL